MNHTTGRSDVLSAIFEAAQPRDEIIRVRVTPAEKDEIRVYCNRIGTRSATLAYQLVIAHVQSNGSPAERRRPEANKKPLPPRRPRMFPGSQSGYGGAQMRRSSL